MFKNMLHMVEKGYVSDLPNILMYVLKRDKYGQIILNWDELTLYHSVGGTSNL